MYLFLVGVKGGKDQGVDHMPWSSNWQVIPVIGLSHLFVSPVKGKKKKSINDTSR